jgi:hypothetical protein
MHCRVHSRSVHINRLAGLLFLLAVFIFVGCSQMREKKTLKDAETKAPTITHAFAVDKGYYGYIWKIYIEAEDPDADMEKIAVIVNHVGYGQYPTDWIILKPQYRGHFIGYLQWNTFSSKAAYLPEWTRLTVKVSIVDESGNESNEVVFPFTFESGVKSEYQDQLPAPFDTGDIPGLGHIMIDIFDGKWGY